MAGPHEGFRDDHDVLQIAWADPESPWTAESNVYLADDNEETRQFFVGESSRPSDYDPRTDAPTAKHFRSRQESDDLLTGTARFRFLVSALVDDAVPDDVEPPKRTLLRRQSKTGYKLSVDPSLRRFQEHSLYGQIILPAVFEELNTITKLYLKKVVADVIDSLKLNPGSLQIDEMGRVVIPPHKRLRLRRRRPPAYRKKTEARQVLSLDEEIRRRFLAEARPALNALAEQTGIDLGLPPELVRLFRNRFLILGPVQAGENRHLLLARDLDTNKLVALKVVLFKPQISSLLEGIVDIPESRFADSYKYERDLFTTEVRISQRLNSTDIPQLIASDVIEEGGYMAIEWIDGQNVSERVRKGLMPVCTQLDSQGDVEQIGVIELGIQLASILEQLHEGRPQVVHRDVKPSNVLVSSTHEVKLTDFGVSVENSNPDQPIMAHQYLTNYSKPYAAPESVGEDRYTSAVDVFGVGGVLYFALTGRPPLPHMEGSSSGTETLARILRSKVKHELPEAPHIVRPDVPQELSDLIMECFEAPEVRPTAGELVDSLVELRRELYPDLPDVLLSEEYVEEYWSEHFVAEVA